MKLENRSMTVLALLTVALMTATLCSSLAAAQATPEVPTGSVSQAVRRTITLGGDLGQWADLPQYKVILSNGVPSVPVKNEGYYSLAFDDKNLYVLGVFDQLKDTVLAKLATDAGEWWNDDVLELYLRTQPFAATPTDLHYAVNPAGTRFKAYTATTDYKSVGRIEDKKWVLELAIPLNSATLPAAKSGDIWGLKVGREHQKAGEYPLWPIGGDFNSPNNFGYLAFTDQKVEAATLGKTIGTTLGKSSVGSPLSSRLSDIGSYSVYYGKSAAEVAQLSNYDLAIVQPSTLSAAQLKTLHDNGTRVAAYLSIGELDKNSSYAAKVSKDWILGTNANWGSQYIDASQPGWQALIKEQADALIKQGFDGFFLDTLDTADLHPKAGPGLVQIVQNLRKDYPNAVLVQNRGFALLNQTAPSLDAVMFESFSSSYNFKDKTYGAVSGDPSFVQNVAKRGLKVLALDYAMPTQLELVTRSFQRAKSFGFVPYVSTINLDAVYTANP